MPNLDTWKKKVRRALSHGEKKPHFISLLDPPEVCESYFFVVALE